MIISPVNSNLCFFGSEPVTVIQKNSKFYLELPPWSEVEKPIWEFDVIDAADGNAVETKIGDVLIFIQRNDFGK